ncbi:hypothetical protein V5799_012342 [Amblyomma americanum]|uniref:Peptidase M13 N-terminal domain-containing protein n=1 Tax=Amblyomma americanum TaxID=6943 RepID=A0AAQ4EE70_AMBAM
MAAPEQQQEPETGQQHQSSCEESQLEEKLSERHLKERPVSRYILGAGVVALVLVLAAVSGLVVQYARSTFHSPPGDVCDTVDCVLHARSILATMNESADPCADLHAHVCGRSGEAETARDTLLRIYSREVVNTLGDAQAFLGSYHGSSAAVKAFAAFAKCLDRGASRDAGNFVAFMRDRGILWPHPPAASKAGADLHGVLDVLLDLTVNWRVALWFDVTVSSNSNQADPIIIIGDIGDVPALRMDQLAGADNFTYADVVQNMSHFLSGGEVTLNEAELVELRQDEAAFRNTLLASYTYADEDEFDNLLPLKDFATLFGPDVSSAEWTTLLGKYLRDAVNVSATTTVLVFKEQQFKRVGNMMGYLPNQRLWNVLGWTFAYAYAWIINADFDSLELNPTTRDVTTRVQCFIATQESFGIAYASPAFRDAFNASDRDKVVAVLNWTSAALVTLANASRAIAESTKTEARSKIESLASTRLWPPEPYLHVGSLDSLYTNFSGEARSFLEIWLQSRKALRAALASPYYDSLLTSRSRFENIVTRLTSFAVYGRINNTSLLRRLDAAKSSGERRQLGDLFALDVAFLAMQTSSVQDPDKWPLRLKSLEALTEVQTFYVSYCSHHCYEPSGRLMCNLAMNASEFNDAFKCDARPRNSSSTCVFV